MNYQADIFRGNKKEMTEKSLPQMMPDVWPIFFQHRRPRPIQAEAMPIILQGKSVLLSGPTASGKTEAVVAPLFQRHISFRRKKLSVIYIAPTKALVNDLFFRLDQYLGIKSKNLIRRYTGDHHEFSVPDEVFLLLVTPEALDSLQLMHQDKLASVRAVVIDEVHLLHGNARGQQLRHVLNRLEKHCVSPEHSKDYFQRIGMTATLQDISGVGKLWLGHDSIAIIRGESRQIEMTFLPIIAKSSKEKAIPTAEVIAQWLNETATRKILVFGNSRNSTHAVAASLYQKFRGTRWPIHWHSGILSKVERERVEDSMKNDRFGICVATSTLEVGIDIGDIDAVILIDPPFSIGSFLQRIGRGNRKTNRCQVVIIYSSEQEKTLFQAIHKCAITGVLDDIYEYDRCSVRFQQILSYAWRGVSKDRSPLMMQNFVDRVCDAGHRKVLDDMLSTGALQDIGSALIPSDDLMDEGERRQIHSILAKSRKTEMIDIGSGDVLVSAPGHQAGQYGAIFIGGTIKNVVEFPDGSVGLMPTQGNQHGLITLPSSRGKRGLNRNIVWALAEIAGENPRVWRVEGNRLFTWGGDDYNKLLILILKLSERKDEFRFDCHAIVGRYDFHKITARKILDMGTDVKKNQSITAYDAESFCCKNRFFSLLSPSMQREEVMNSIPFDGFFKWLLECSG
ncbi:MAG: DEAD/DEAH box helicase [Chlorobium sp.]|nr:DEAD/DEAH box helicase [Chlorobium sp.]